MKSITDNVDILSQDEISNISSAALPKVVTKEKTVEEHLQETIKENNQEFLKKSSSFKLKVTPPRRSSRIKLSSEKPYDKPNEK